MFKTCDKDQFNANTLSIQLKLAKKSNPPPQLIESKMFDRKPKKVKTKGTKKKNCKKKNFKF